MYWRRAVEFVRDIRGYPLGGVHFAVFIIVGGSQCARACPPRFLEGRLGSVHRGLMIMMAMAMTMIMAMTIIMAIAMVMMMAVMVMMMMMMMMIVMIMVV